MSSVISLTDRLAGSVQSIGGYRARVAEDLSGRTRLRLQQGKTNPTNKRFKRSITTQPIDITSETESYKQFSSLESEVDSTASSGSKVVNKIEVRSGACKLIYQEYAIKIKPFLDIAAWLGPLARDH